MFREMFTLHVLDVTIHSNFVVTEDTLRYVTLPLPSLTLHGPSAVCG